jgi:dGTP triphosphohydrolase
MARRMPTSDEIEDLAKKLYWLDHPESMGITPEREELSEGNYLIKARDLLMRGEEGPILAEYDRMVHEWAKAVREDAEKLGFVLVPKKDWEKMKPEDVAKVYEELELVKAREKKWKKKLEEKEIAEAEYKKQMEQEISELKKRIAELTEVKAPKALSKEEIAKLEDAFRAVLFRELGRIPRDAMSEFRVELETVKTLPYEEALKVIEMLAKDIAERERVRRVVPVAAPPEVAPAAPPTPAPPIEVAKPPAVPIEPMSFPRRLSSSEINAFWKAFETELLSVGLNPADYMEYWVRFRDAWHQDWFHVLRAFKEMIDDIKARKMPRYYPRT